MTAPDFTLFDVLAWARTKPADETYDFYDADVCAIAQFGQATGRECLVGLGELEHDGGLSSALAEAVVGDNGPDGWTFGALVTRLEALCPGSEWVRVETYVGRCPAGRSGLLRTEPEVVSALREPAAIARGAA